jgi:hypothetical protein
MQCFIKYVDNLFDGEDTNNPFGTLTKDIKNFTSIAYSIVKFGKESFSPTNLVLRTLYCSLFDVVALQVQNNYEDKVGKF